MVSSESKLVSVSIQSWLAGVRVVSNRYTPEPAAATTAPSSSILLSASLWTNVRGIGHTRG